MNRTTATAAALLAAGLLLTGCSGSSDTADTKPSPKPSKTSAAPTATPTLDGAEATRRCVNAMADEISADADYDPYADTPAECEQLPEADLMDAYMDGLHQVNQSHRDELQKRIDEAEQEDAGQ